MSNLWSYHSIWGATAQTAISKETDNMVTKLTDWSAGMVQMSREDPNHIRICADLTNLKQTVNQDTQPSRAVASSLAKISGSYYLTKHQDTTAVTMMFYQPARYM